ncbi:helix-turn-helix domain-containing protein [Paenibacillus sp. 481]|nr:helix-turn-helix domain-containing protein [Paenibacillus sp. 481]
MGSTGSSFGSGSSSGSGSLGTSDASASASKSSSSQAGSLNMDYSMDYAVEHHAPTSNATTGTHVQPSQATSKLLRLSAYEEVWKLAVLSGHADSIAAAIERWVNDVSKQERITPEQLELWSRDWEVLRARITHEAVGDAAEELLARHNEQSELAAANAAEPFSLDNWRQAWLGSLTRLSQLLLTHQGQEQHIIFDIAKYVEQHYHEDLSLQDMAQRFFVSREYISRKFKQQFNINLSDYMANIRIEKAKMLLFNPHLRISQVANMVGYHDEKYFSKVFKKQTGVSPNEFRKQQKV